FAVVAHLALTDMLLTLFMVCGILCLFHRLQGGNLWILGAGYVALGFAVLVKGPVALALVGAALVLYLFFARPGGTSERWYQYWWRNVWSLHPLAGLFLIAVISVPWYVAECTATKGEFFQEFFIRQNLGRVAGSVNHQQPWHYYIPFLIGGLFPWWLVWVSAPKAVARFWTHRKIDGGQQRLALLCTCWLVLVIALFSAVKTKLGTYILPAFPPFAILTGLLLDRLIRGRKLLPLKISATVVACAGVAGLLAVPVLLARLPISKGAAVALAGGALLLCAAFAGCLVMLKRKQWTPAVLSATGGGAAAVAILVSFGLHQYDKQQHRPFRDLLKDCQAQHANVATFLRDSPAANFYLCRQVPILQNREDFSVFLKSTKGPHFVLLTRDVQKLAQERAPKLFQLERRGKWFLFSID
ncbi:MAG: ArnT family glycosyltransferase, partial [Candidatus Angelobacter sp.]